MTQVMWVLVKIRKDSWIVTLGGGVRMRTRGLDSKLRKG